MKECDMLPNNPHHILQNEDHLKDISNLVIYDCDFPIEEDKEQFGYKLNKRQYIYHMFVAYELRFDTLTRENKKLKDENIELKKEISKLKREK